MRTWTKTAGLLFLAVSSVYADPAKLATVVSGATPPDAAGAVKVLESAAAGAPAPTVAIAPAAAPAAATPAEVTPATPAAPTAAAEPTSQPATTDAAAVPTQGRSVSETSVVVSDTGTVELHVNEANLVEVLRMLSIQSQKNIIASKEVQGIVTANLYDVTVREALDAILKANGFGYREKGNFIYVYSSKEIADMDKADRKMSSEVFRLYYTPAANAQNMLKPVLSEGGQVAYTQAATSGIATGTSDVGGNTHATEDSIVVTDFPENLDRVRALLKDLDRRPQQILIEATILRAALTNDNSLGVDFNFLGGVDFGTLTHSNGQITNADIGTAAATGTPGVLNTTHAESYGTGNNFTSGSTGFKVGVLTNDFSLFVNALETSTNTTVLANPKILALNKQRGEVIVGRKDGYYTTTVTENATVQTVDFLETGTRLVFRPFVGDDGYVRMEIHPEDSQGGLNAANLPFKVTTEVTSNILVKDGHTIVIGGLFREQNQTTTSQVPLLGSLPVAGALFRKQDDVTNREEVIILLTPHVIKDESSFAEASEKLASDANKLRVGIRQGMMPWSRSRLAEIAYDQARSEMDKPDGSHGKANFLLSCAINLDPMFPEAVKMKESLTGNEVVTTDHSNAREFVKREILAERAAGATTQPAEHSVPLESRRDRENAAQAKKTMAEMKQTAEKVDGEVATALAKASATPATQPSVAQAEVADEDSDAVTTVAQSPSTQPSVAQAPTAAAQPQVAEAAAPASQPATVAAAPTAVPSTQPVASVDNNEPAVIELPAQDSK